MLPTFVIGLREGLEAALIVGIVAAFLRKQGRKDLLRWVFVGVGAAIALCVAVGVALKVLSQDLPQRQQEGLETIIGLIAVGMVTYMVVWMRRHARELKGQLEGMAADAMAGSSRGARAMIAMAFLAVLREGFETVVFLLAAFNESTNGSSAALGASLGIVVAVGLGYGIYRGGVKINLAKFFRATGLVLVLVAAGLVVNALHTAHEAGWLNIGQGGTVDLTWLVEPGTVQASLLTGMLGIQGRPVVIEVIGWLMYLIPVACYVAWPPGRSIPRRIVSRTLLSVGGVLVLLGVSLAVFAPAVPSAVQPGTSGLAVVSLRGDSAVVRTQVQSPAASGAETGPLQDLTVTRTGSEIVSGVATDVYAATLQGRAAMQQPTELTLARVAELNGGRLPIGLRTTGAAAVPVRYTDSTVLTVWVEPRMQHALDVRWSEQVLVSAVSASVGPLALAAPIAHAVSNLPAPVVSAAATATRSALHQLDRRGTLHGWAWTVGLPGLALLLAGVGYLFADRRRPASVGAVTPDAELIHS